MEDEAAFASEVMTRYCAGDQAAFHRLYALLAPRILAYLWGLIGEKPTAEDLLQQTFLKVHEARSVFVFDTMAQNSAPKFDTAGSRSSNAIRLGNEYPHCAGIRQHPRKYDLPVTNARGVGLLRP